MDLKQAQEIMRRYRESPESLGMVYFQIDVVSLSGRYGVAAVMKNGNVVLKAMGFHTASDAQVYHELRSALAEGTAHNQDCNFSHHEIVKLEPAVTSAQLDSLPRLD